MAKVPLNYCSFEDLLAIPGATPACIACLLGLRAQCGDVTPELLEASPDYEEVKDLQGSLDFRPREAAGDAPVRPGGSQPLSETGDVGSTPADTPGEVGNGERGAPVYPRDRYPPPQGAEEARQRPRPAARTENKGGDVQLWGEGDSAQPREFGNRHNLGWSNAPRRAYQDEPSGPAREDSGVYWGGGGGGNATAGPTWSHRGPGKRSVADRRHTRRHGSRARVLTSRCPSLWYMTGGGIGGRFSANSVPLRMPANGTTRSA